MLLSKSKNWGGCYGKHPVTQWPSTSTLGTQLEETAITSTRHMYRIFLVTHYQTCPVAMGSKMNKWSTEWSAREHQGLGTTVFFRLTRGFSDISECKWQRQGCMCCVIHLCRFQTQVKLAIVAGRWAYGCSWHVSDRKWDPEGFLEILLLSLDAWVSSRENASSSLH